MDEKARAAIRALEVRVNRLESDNKKLKKERDSFKKQVKLFLKRLGMGFKF